jgi:GTP cyclohydrolase I
MAKANPKIKKVSCQICGFLSTHLRSHLKVKHDLSIDDYKKQYPEAKIYDETYTQVRQITAQKSNALWSNPEVRKNRTEGIKKEWAQRESISFGTAKRKILEERGVICEKCKSTKNIDVHHLDGQNYGNTTGNHKEENLMILCKSCHGRLHRLLEKTEKTFYGEKNIEKGVSQILYGLQKQFGIDLNDENLVDTPKRVARAYIEMFWGLKEDPKEILSKRFKIKSNGMIVWTKITFYSMCSHHFLPFEGTVNVAILPSDDEVVGISKIARLVECFAKRPQLQERMNEEIANAIVENLSPDCMVVSTATHMCMQCRGVEQEDSPFIVSSIRGKFKQPEVRMEALALMKK